MKSKVAYFLVPLLILVSGFALMRKQAPSATMELQRFGSKVRAMSLEAPKNVTFAGERVPTDRPYVEERLTRELRKYLREISTTTTLVRRAGRYQDRFIAILADYGIPADFFYLSMIESNLSNAVSPAGAAGFWQLMPETARRYGLEVSDQVDERLNVEKATYAAARYLRDLRQQFDSWILVAAAYNRGEAGLQRALDRQAGDDYFSLHLNRETARYVYRALALKICMEQPERYGIELPEGYHPIYAYSVDIDQSIQNIPLYILDNSLDPESFRQLNAWILQDYLEVPEGQSYQLRFPVGKVIAPELEIIDRSGLWFPELENQG